MGSRATPKGCRESWIRSGWEGQKEPGEAAGTVEHPSAQGLSPWVPAATTQTRGQEVTAQRCPRHPSNRGRDCDITEGRAQSWQGHCHQATATGGDRDGTTAGHSMQPWKKN